MSDLPGHDHDPDPAALDELRRAFSGDVAARDERDETERRGERDETERRDERDEPHDPSGAITEPTPVQSRRNPPSPHEIDAERSAEPDGSPASTPDPIRVVTLADLGSGSTGRDDDPEPTPPSLTDLAPGADDDPDEHLDHDATPEVDAPERLVIVEPGPPAEPAARIIRIDGYSGSSEIAPDTLAPVDPLQAGPSQAEPDGSDVSGGSGGSGGGVISISGDDLPDAVYVEGNLDREGGGTIVFIENDESGDTLAPDSERDMRRGIEPRMRERRVAVRRAQGRRRLKRALLVVGIIALVVGVLAVLGSPLFAVRAENVQVFGVGYARGEQFDRIIDDAVGTPVLRLDTTGIEEDLEAIPWIDDAEVRADFPHGLVIDVRERAAVATYQGPDGRFRVLDREGRVLDVIEDGYPYAYVLLGGPDAVDLEPGEFAPQGYAAASELAKNLTSSLRGHVVRIEVLADGSRLVLELDDGSTVYFGEARDLLAKLVRLEAVLGNNQDCPPGLIDVSTADTTRPRECSTSS